MLRSRDGGAAVACAGAPFPARAAAEMGMAYSKAWRILRDCEGALGFPLLDSTTGGRHGGGAVLTAEAEALLSDYETFCRRLREEGDSLFSECFERWMN